MQTAEPKGSSVFPAAKVPALRHTHAHTHTVADTPLFNKKRTRPIVKGNRAYMSRDKVANDDTKKNQSDCVCARAIVHIFGYHSMGVSLHVSSPCVAAVSALQRIPCLTCTRQTGSRAGSCRCTSPRKRTWSVLTGDSDPLACGSEESSPSMKACVRVPD